MNKDQREIQRKLRILHYADEIGHVAKACRYFGIGRASFIVGVLPTKNMVKAGWLVVRPYPNSITIERQWKLKTRFFICVVNTTWDRYGSFGIWSAIMTLEYRNQRFSEY